VRRGRESRRDRLGGLAARLPEVGMEVDEARRDDDARPVDPGRIRAGQPLDRLERAIADDEVGRSRAAG